MGIWELIRKDLKGGEKLKKWVDVIYGQPPYPFGDKLKMKNANSSLNQKGN